MTYKLALAAVSAAFALSACGGGTSGGTSATLGSGSTPSATVSSSPAGTPLTSSEVQQVDAAYTTYADRVTAGTLSADSPSGQASMTGGLGISGVSTTDPSVTVAGKLTMDVNFDANSLTGKVSDLGVYSGNEFTKIDNVTGSLDVAGTTGGTGLSATATGQLSDSSNQPTDFNLGMNGTFYNDAGNLVTIGDVSGTMTPQGEAARNVDGNFVATQN